MFSYTVYYDKCWQWFYILCSPRKVRTPRKTWCSLEGAYHFEIEKSIHKFPLLLYVGKYCNRHWRNCWLQFVGLFFFAGALSFICTSYAPCRRLCHHFLRCLLECPCNLFMLETCGSIRIVVAFVLILKFTARDCYSFLQVLQTTLYTSLDS